jgi:hypothetical protein
VLIDQNSICNKVKEDSGRAVLLSTSTFRLTPVTAHFERK